MRFHEISLNYSKVENSNLIEMSTPSIKMNAALQSFLDDDNITEIQRELAEYDYNERINSIGSYYDEVSDSVDRDLLIIETVDRFTNTLDNIRTLDDRVASKALESIAVKSNEHEIIKHIVTEVHSPLISLNTYIGEKLRDDSLSMSKVYLINREHELTIELMMSYKNDIESIQSLVDGLKETVREIMSMTDDEVQKVVGEPIFEDLKADDSMAGVDKKSNTARLRLIKSSD